jgi:hypothetical protein
VDTYPYELLDGRRFQQLAQTLLVREYRDIQCMPISGPDGGRDAILMRHEDQDEDDRLTDAVIFQVKFREPQMLGTPSTDDLFNWLTGAIVAEAPKLQILRDRGAKQYIVVTNVPATGHLEKGLRDRVQEFLDNAADIPAHCWWRDDLDARLAGHFDLVVHFGLFKGPESLRVILEGVLSQRHTPRTTDIASRSTRDPAVTALLAYLDAQYREDARLRFKQADLPASPLLDFFIDVPVEVMVKEASPTLRNLFDELALSRADGHVSRIEPKVDLIQGSQASGETVEQDIDDGDDIFEEDYYFPYYNPGGADLLLTDQAAVALGKVVIEGAPGQGKSTLGQYLCQVHRIRLLRKESDSKLLPASHLNSPVRLPFRIELRHLATYLRGRNPWERTGDKALVPPEWAASLESYIAAAIRSASGGLTCNQDDIVAIMSKTPSLIVLDGLDEVADIDDRTYVVSVVQESLKRLSALGANHQVIVTSRPAAFVKAPSFSRKDFVYLVLRDLPRKLIDEFAERWIRMRDLPLDQAADFRTILKSNLDRAHVADLARNPMQLAILLWLIFVKGWSLPDRRTALYEAYMDTFLNREAEKSVVVRQHREILLELHGHLGWVLHAQSEAGAGRAGDMEEAELRAVLKAYLVREERPPELVDDLFKGVERMFVLVSRIEGRFEFEVQPLREFFAARHLYKTSPHSTSAAPAPGSRPDRLEALIRNPYWFNVARFFCGWYDKGELADLTRRLGDLCDDPTYRVLGHPRVLIARLLRDYVTTASRRDTRTLAAVMLNDLGLRLVLADSNEPRRPREARQYSPALPSDAGLDTLLDSVQSRFLEVRSNEQQAELARVLAHPDLGAQTAEWWAKNIPMEDKHEFSRWLRVGVITEAIPHVPLDLALKLFSPSRCSGIDWWRCVEGNRGDVAVFDNERLQAVAHAIAAGACTRFPEYRSSGSWLHQLTRALWTGRFFDRRQAYASIVLSRNRPSAQGLRKAGPTGSEMPELFNDLRQLNLHIAGIVGNTDRKLWYSTLGPYDQVSTAVTETLGECWAGWKIALIGATVPGRRGGSKGGLFEQGESLAARARRARLLPKDRTYWLDQVAAAGNRHERMVVAASSLAWAHTDIWPALFEAMTPWWGDLELHEVGELRKFVPRLSRISQPGRRRPSPITPGIVSEFGEAVPGSLLSFSLLRTNKAQHGAVAERLETASGGACHQPWVSTDVLSLLLSHLKRHGDWPALSNRIATHYSRALFGLNLMNDPFTYHDFQTRISRFTEDILGDPRSYPLVLVRAADSAASAKVVRRLPPLISIARQDSWFTDD